jgi:hypothetical protein
MATLISVFNSKGECVGRCDANCYEASDPHCDCICQGENHGMGLGNATKNTEVFASFWKELAKREIKDFRLGDGYTQPQFHFSKPSKPITNSKKISAP